MARMREPFTGGVFDVPASRVEKYLGRGYALLDGEPKPASVDEVESDHEQEPAETPVATTDEPKPASVDEVESDHEQEPAETPVATTDEPKPTADSTIAEIRAWAKAHGVALPKKGNKAALLAAIG